MFNKLFAVCLLVNDFYKNVLGLKVNSHEGKFANFKLEGAELAIFQKDEATSMFPKEYMSKGGSAVIGFQVDDVKKACADLKTKGVKIFEGPKTTEWGQTVAYLNDLDGNIWEVSSK